METGRNLDLTQPGSKILKALLTKVKVVDGKPIRTPMLHDEDIKPIAQLAKYNPHMIQMGAYLPGLGMSQQENDEIVAKQLARIPEERKPYINRFAQVISNTHSIPIKISLANINPFTQFENHPPILFGMGGGSQRLCQGLPFDVLSMVLTAEKLRRELDLGTINILCANDITHTNIGKHPEFSIESIDRVMSAERDLLRLVIDRFGFGDHFRIFLSTDLEKEVGPGLKQEYDEMVLDAKEVPFVYDQYYAMEIAEMYSLINQSVGGVKLGWFMNNADPKNPKYIMDEQPFDARYALYLASRRLTNKVSIPYARAGVRLYPDSSGHAQKVPPYIDYDPKNRILLSPFEDAVTKMIEASKAGGGTNFKYIRRHFFTINKLFEELVLGHTVRKDRLSEKPEKGYTYGKRIQDVLDFIFADKPEAKEIWRQAFPV